MKVLVTFAVDWEFKPWLRLRPFQEAPAGRHLFRTQIAGSNVKVALTGMGPANALRTIRESRDELPDVCIVSGLSGSLRRHHRTGEILAARAVRPEHDGESIRSEETLVNAAIQCGAKAVDQFISSGRVVREAKEKSLLSASADAVDMESFVIMKELSGLGVPGVAIRSVADSAEMDVPYDFDRALDGSGRIRITRVFGQVVRDPRQVWPLAQFGARSLRAARSLARFLDGYLAYLAAHKEKMDFSVQCISQ